MSKLSISEKHDAVKAAVILKNYLKQYAKSFGELGSGENYDGMPPNHKTTTPENADNKALRVGSAMWYVHWCNKAIEDMFNSGFDDQALLLKRKYMTPNGLTDDELKRRMSITNDTFYRHVNSALVIFSDECVTLEFNRMYKKVHHVVKS